MEAGSARIRLWRASRRAHVHSAFMSYNELCWWISNVECPGPRGGDIPRAPTFPSWSSRAPADTGRAPQRPEAGPVCISPTYICIRSSHGHTSANNSLCVLKFASMVKWCGNTRNLILLIPHQAFEIESVSMDANSMCSF